VRRFVSMPVCESCDDIGRNETRSGADARERHCRFHLNFAGVVCH
jgi:hypothetical protein